MMAKTRAGLSVLRCWARAGTEEMLWLAQTVGERYGHIRSVREARPVTAEGEPIPWYTYPALEYLNQFDFTGWDAFEFGGGNSTKYWSKRCRSLVTVESDPSWHAVIAKDARPSQKVILETDPVRYAGAIAEGDRQYKLIVIDGEHRRACAERALGRLAPGGMIIFDNADWWPETCAFLRGQGFMQVDFTGPGPINRYTWTTSILFPALVDLKLASERQPAPGIGSLRQVASPE
jgi:hypothetical protein